MIIKYQNQYWVTQTPTFGDLAAAYAKEHLSHHANDGSAKTKCTIAAYKYLLTKHILPRWGDVKANKITFRVIGNWLDDPQNNLSPSTCIKAGMMMSLVFDFAARSGLCSIPNPLKWPKKDG